MPENSLLPYLSKIRELNAFSILNRVSLVNVCAEEMIPIWLFDFLLIINCEIRLKASAYPSMSLGLNLKILLMFPKIDKLIYEYLILEINKDTNELVWNSINYEQLLDEIFILLNNFLYRV